MLRLHRIFFLLLLTFCMSTKAQIPDNEVQFFLIDKSEGLNNFYDLRRQIHNGNLSYVKNYLSAMIEEIDAVLSQDSLTQLPYLVKYQERFGEYLNINPKDEIIEVRSNLLINKELSSANWEEEWVNFFLYFAFKREVLIDYPDSWFLYSSYNLFSSDYLDSLIGVSPYWSSFLKGQHDSKLEELEVPHLLFQNGSYLVIDKVRALGLLEEVLSKNEKNEFAQENNELIELFKKSLEDSKVELVLHRSF